MAVSQYEFRTVNLKRFLLLAAVLAALGTTGYAVHRMQVRKNSEMMLRLAQNTRQVGNLAESLALYEKYLNFRPRDTAVLAEYAEALEQAIGQQPKRLREVFEVYERVLSADPVRHDDRRKLINRYIDIGAYARAAEHLTTLMKFDPQLVHDATVMEQSALCAEKLGKSEDAIARYRAAIETGKASSDAYLRLAGLLQATPSATSMEESRKLLERLVQDRPRDAAARLARARYFLSTDQPGEAIRELDIALADCPGAADMPELVLLLAEQHRRAGNLPAARLVLARAVQARPAEPRYRIVLADLHMATGQPEEAAEQLTAAIRLPNLEEPSAVETLDRMINHRELLALVDQELRQRYGDTPGAFADYLRGKLALATGDWPVAQQRLERALPNLEKTPRALARAYEALGHCARAAGNPDRMAAMYEKALAIDPLLDSARLSLADTLVRLGRSAEAAATYQRYAASSPAARLRLAQLSMAEQLAKPADRQNWNAFDETLGPPPRRPELEQLRIISLRLRNRGEQALAAAQQLVRDHPRDPRAYITLAALQAESDLPAALDVIRSTRDSLGDRVELRLAQAALLSRQTPVNSNALRDLEDNAGMFAAVDRYALYMGLAQVQARQLRNPSEAARLFGLAAELRPTDLNSRTARFDALLAEKRFEEATALLAEIRSLEGGDGPYTLFCQTALELVRDAPLDAKRLAELRSRIAPVLQARPNWGRALLLAAELDDAAGDAESALTRFRRAFALGERRPAAVQRLVSMLVSRRRLEEARRVLAEAEQWTGLSGDLERQAGMLDAILAKSSERVEAFVRRAAESNKPEDHVFRGQWLLLMNQPRDAVAAFEQAITMDPKLADGWLGLLTAHDALGDRTAAAAAWERAQAAFRSMPHPDPAMLHCLLGVGREALSDFLGAEQFYKDGLAAHPNHPRLLHQYAVLCQRLERLPEAVTLYRTLLNVPADEVLKAKARRELALATLAGPNPFARVPAALEILAANNPANAEDLRARGLILSYDPFRRIEARNLLEQAAALAAPTQDDALRLAEFYVRDGRNDQAEEVLRETIKSSPRVPLTILALLHQLQQGTGRVTDASETLSRLKALAPNSWEAAVEQARVLVGSREYAEAAAMLSQHPLVAEPSAKLNVLLPELQSLGCMNEAEALARSLVSVPGLSGRHMGLISVLGARQRYLEALQAALELPDAEYPPAVKARALMMMLVHLPRTAVPVTELTAWDQTADAINRWLDATQANAPNDPALLTLQGVLADARGLTEQAIRRFEQALAANSTSETAANGLAYLLTLGPGAKPERAESLVNDLIQHVGPKPALLDTRAAARLAQGKIAEAAADINAAIVQMPAKGVYWFRLAQVQEKKGEIDNCRLSFQKARQLGVKKVSLHPLEWPAFERLEAAMIP